METVPDVERVLNIAMILDVIPIAQIVQVKHLLIP
jgi:hypothetical protein